MNSDLDVASIQPGEVVWWQSTPSLLWVAVSNSHLLVLAIALSSAGSMALTAEWLTPAPGYWWAVYAMIFLSFGGAAVVCLGSFVRTILASRGSIYRISSRGISCTSTLLWGYRLPAVRVLDLQSWSVSRGASWGARGTLHLRRFVSAEHREHIRMIGVQHPEDAFRLLQLLQRGELPTYPR